MLWYCSVGPFRGCICGSELKSHDEKNPSEVSADTGGRFNHGAGLLSPDKTAKRTGGREPSLYPALFGHEAGTEAELSWTKGGKQANESEVNQINKINLD